MNRPGGDPTRRNRNIGTSKQGHRRQSRFGVPDPLHADDSDRRFYERVGEHVVTRRDLRGSEIVFIVERVTGDCVHACTPDDVIEVLSKLPADLAPGLEPLKGIVLRQPTRKQESLRPVWGRLAYHAEVGDELRGPAIFLDAYRPFESYGFPRKMDLELQGEFERAEMLLGPPTLARRGHVFPMGFQGLRRWLLYHTLLHEVGHWVDYLRNVMLPVRRGEGEWNELWDRYHERGREAKEAFAHRFSDEWRAALAWGHKIPFGQQLDERALRRDGIDPAWFRAPSRAATEAGAEVEVREWREPLDPAGLGGDPGMEAPDRAGAHHDEPYRIDLAPVVAVRHCRTPFVPAPEATLARPPSRRRSTVTEVGEGGEGGQRPTESGSCPGSFGAFTSTRFRWRVRLGHGCHAPSSTAGRSSLPDEGPGGAPDVLR